MIAMVLKMSGMTALYVLLTTLLWLHFRGKQLTTWRKTAVGVFFGICSVLSTHFAVDYGSMLLNVRDIGPLAAGLFFHPVCGVIAGLIGGIERYIAGTYWNVGAYTRIACSVSTCLAGLLTVPLHVFIFRRKKPTASYAFLMGAVVEVFHMYVVLITHRNDMEMAFYVVRICSGPMILFTGLGLWTSALVLRVLDGEWVNPLRHRRPEEITVSHRFRMSLFMVTLTVALIVFGFSFMVQTKSALQTARETLDEVSEDIDESYVRVQSTQAGIEALSKTLALTDANVIARAVMNAADKVDEDYLEILRQVFGLVNVSLISPRAERLMSAGDAPMYSSVVAPLTSGKIPSQALRMSSERVVAASRLDDIIVQVVIDTDEMAQLLNQSGLYDSLSFYHVGSDGSFDIISPRGYSLVGTHRGQVMSEWGIAESRLEAGETYFTEVMFGQESLCRVERLKDDAILLAVLPTFEVYTFRNMQALETGLAGILVFAAIFVLITILVQQMVVNNLELVNVSLNKITDGDLDEVVNVRESLEFATLSDGINQTVGVLKGYIVAAEKRIEQELELARTIQDAALPKNFNFPREDFELYAIMDPAREVGGDFYDFFFIDSNRLVLVIADVSGKGIPASLFMMRSQAAIRSLASSGSSPSEILYQANNTLCDGNDAEMFVTAWIGIIDLRNGEMHCANAGHEYPVLMRAGADYELYQDKHGLALAAMEGMHYREYTLTLSPGDRLFVYTDGVPEAIDADEQQYGTDRLCQVLNTLKDAAMSDMLPTVREDVARFAGEVEQFDDITMLGFVYYGVEGRKAP